MIPKGKKMVGILPPSIGAGIGRNYAFQRKKIKADSTNSPHWNIEGSSAYKAKKGYNKFLHSIEN